MKKYAISFTLLFLFINMSFAQMREVTLLYTNDIESVYDPVEAFWNDEIELIGGIPYLSTLIKQIKETEKLSFLFDSGDIYTGALAQATEGRLAFDIYSHFGYDAVTIGNHEFEYGWEVLDKVRYRAEFPFLNCNIFYENTDINFAQPYTIVERDGFRIGVIGAIGVDAFINTMNKIHREGLEVRNPIPLVQKYIDYINDEVDLIVVLTHQNRPAPMQTDKEADPEVQRGIEEDYDMAGQLIGADVILGGHCDNGLWEPIIHPETSTIICQTFGQGKYLGYLKLNVESEAITIAEAKLIPVESANLEPDQKVVDLIHKARASAPQITKVIGELDKLASRKYYRESTLGNLMADILRYSAKSDIAVVNSGSLRADLNPGKITIEDLINVYPFIGPFHVVEITGDGVKKLLEHSYSLAYGFTQLSGVETVYDTRKPVGKRVIKAMVGGEPLDPTKKYTVASSAFVAYGGDNYSMLADGKLIYQSEKRKIDYFIDYFINTGSVTAPIVGRQIDLSRK